MKGVLNGLDLFSGIGGLTLALQGWVEPVAYCENDKYAQAVLLSRMQEGRLPEAPIWDDVRTLTKSEIDLPVDIIYAGFPCQDISCAGKGAGLAGKRSGLFFEIVRLAQEIKPTFIFLENVSAIRTRGLDTVGRELATLRYDCRWGVISAYDVGAPHKRERWFLLAYARCNRWEQGTEILRKRESEFATRGKSMADTECARELQSERCKQKQRRRAGNESQGVADDSEHRCRQGRARGLVTGSAGKQEQTFQNVANTKRNRLQRGVNKIGRQGEAARQRRPANEGGQAMANSDGRCRPEVTQPVLRTVPETTKRARYPEAWSTEPDVGRVAHGVPFRVDRLKGLGNAVVPAQARAAFKRLMGINSKKSLTRWGI